MSSILEIEGCTIANTFVEEKGKRECRSTGKLPEFELSDR